MEKISHFILKNNMKLIVIIKKELLDQIRDKRTIVASILMPAVIVPLLLFILSQPASNKNLDLPIRIIIQKNQNHIQSAILQSFKNAQFINSDSPSKSIKNGKAELFIDINNSTEPNQTMTIYYDSARRISVLSNLKIHNFLIHKINMPKVILNNTNIKSQAIRSDEENKTLLTIALILPVFIMIFAASSTMTSIIDMSSGEKERSTLEPLLSCNISHTNIIMGKILAASTIGFISVIFLLSGLLVCSQAYPEITGGLSLLKFSSLANIFFVISITFVSVFLFSTFGMAIGLYAKSVKEGNILMLPVIVLSSALSSGLIASDPFTINKFYLLIPVLNFSHLIRSAIYNQHDVFLLMITVFFNMAYAFLFLIISHYLIKKEKVIFRS
ncbi:MAG: hypothetical protein ACD_79C00025G0008 [uncultured bacterium]|nr:MAG: hypothetical protein ACD_79C00025G0008 [uncultured bacterium]